jgi:hypothetical protein
MKLSRQFLQSALIIGLVGVSPLTLSACEEKGPAEKAGEAVDDAARDAKKALKDATK